VELDTTIWIYTNFVIRKMKLESMGFIYVNKLPKLYEYRSTKLESVISIKKEFEYIYKEFGNHIEYIIVSYQKEFYLLTKEEYEKISN
jgi:hypothetical protein